MKRSASPPWSPRYSYGDALVGDLCAVADARARVELLPLPADESLRLRHAAYQRSTRSSTRIEGNPLDDQAVRVAIATADREGSQAEQEVRNYWRALDRVEEWAQGSSPLSEAWIQ
jgi:Fic family protein